ncbi:uncharacterized protein stbd1 [Pagrus major]|uniref:uncharacterized protein stbd1 n=1 Tax=Pagrus major TaxID=143350 RepID=UPI003CC8715A
MSLKNSNTVAVERRVDLASLFCMIGRHGPAVALAVIAMVSVLAGFIIYRTVRGKRRKATADGGDRSPAAEGQPSPEECDSPEEATDDSSDVKEDVELIQGDLKIRHRRAAAAAEKQPPPYSPPKTDIQATETRNTTSDDTEEREVVWDSYRAAGTYAEVANQSLHLAEMVVEDAVDCQQGATDDAVEDVIEEVIDTDSCLKEPVPITDENQEEEEKVLKEEYQEDEDMTTDRDVSGLKTSQEKENFESALNNPVCLEQTLHMGEKAEDDTQQDNKTRLETNSLESNSEEPVIHIEDVPVPCVCYGKDEFEEESPDSIDYSSYSGNNSLSPEEENEDERAEEECVDFEVVAQQPELWSSTSEQETNLPSIEQEKCDHVMDKVVSPIQDCNLDKGNAQAGEEIDEVVDVELSSVKMDTCLSQFEKEEVEIEQREENGLNQEHNVLYDGADQMEEEMLTSEEGDSTSVAPLKVCDHEDGLSGVAIDPKAQISGEADFPDMSSGHQPQREDQIDPSLDDNSGYSGNNSLSPEEEKKNEGDMAEEECADSQVAAQQAEISSSTVEQETNLPSTQQDQSDHVPPIGDNDPVGDDGVTGEVIEEVVDEDDLNKITAVQIDTHSPQLSKKEVENEPKEENDLNQTDGDFCSGADQVEEKMMIIVNNVVCTEEVDGSSVALPCLSVCTKVDNLNDGLSSITTDAKAQNPGVADFPDLSFGSQPQKEDKIAPCLDEDTDATILGQQIPSHETENLPEISKNGQTEVLAEECNDQVLDPQNVQMIDNEVFDKASVAADSDTVENVTASVIVEEIPCAYLPSSCQDQQSACKEIDETFDETSINSAADAVPCNNTNLNTFLMSEEISHLNMSSSQDQQCDDMKNNEDFSVVTTDAAPVTMKDSSLPLCQSYLTSFEQSEQKDSAISSPGFGEESGISSMAVSPDLQYAGNEFDMTIGNIVVPVMDCELQSEGQTEAQNSHFADDAAVSVTHQDTAGMVFGPYPSRHSQEPCSERTDWTKYESFAANEDMFGHEIEEIYHREMDQFAAQIAASVTSYTDELKIQTELKPVIEVVEIKEKKAGVTVEKKEDTKAEKEKEEDYEKSEISIMEATMDNNEWITESNYQVLPWMNLSASSFAQDQTKTSQLPTEECQYSSAVTDTTSTDTTDISSSTEVKQTSTLSLIEENMETNKKVVAVQPMPQNVNVTFRVHYSTESPYQTVAVTGNQQELGNWKEFIPLERAKDGNWTAVVSLPVESHVEWKFVLLDKGEVCRWEECGNRLLDTGFEDDLLVHKWWGLL